jgi:hypothetical protein
MNVFIKVTGPLTKSQLNKELSPECLRVEGTDIGYGGGRVVC